MQVKTIKELRSQFSRFSAKDVLTGFYPIGDKYIRLEVSSELYWSMVDNIVEVINSKQKFSNTKQNLKIWFKGFALRLYSVNYSILDEVIYTAESKKWTIDTNPEHISLLKTNTYKLFKNYINTYKND